MFISFIAEDGTPYVLPVRQVVIHAADGQPCAATYEHGGLIIHTDLAKADFSKQCASLRIKPLDLKALKK